jgi:hypothetical protein
MQQWQPMSALRSPSNGHYQFCRSEFGSVVTVETILPRKWNNFAPPFVQLDGQTFREVRSHALGFNGVVEFDDCRIGVGMWHRVATS